MPMTNGPWTRTMTGRRKPTRLSVAKATSRAGTGRTTPPARVGGGTRPTAEADAAAGSGRPRPPIRAARLVVPTRAMRPCPESRPRHPSEVSGATAHGRGVGDRSQDPMNHPALAKGQPMYDIYDCEID